MPLLNFIFFLFLSLPCIAQELDPYNSLEQELVPYTPIDHQVLPYSSLIEMQSHLEKIDSNNPYWNMYVPKNDNSQESFIIFPKEPHNPSQVHGVSFFLKPLFTAVIFPTTSDLPLSYDIRTYIPSILDVTFLLTHSQISSYRIFFERDFRYDPTDITKANLQNIIGPYTLNKAVLQEFNSLFPLFPVNILDNIPSFRDYLRFQEHMDSLPTTYTSNLEITNFAKTGLDDKKHPVSQKILSNFLQNLYTNIQISHIQTSSQNSQKYSEIFFYLSGQLRDTSLPNFSLIKQWAFNISPSSPTPQDFSEREALLENNIKLEEEIMNIKEEIVNIEKKLRNKRS